MQEQLRHKKRFNFVKFSAQAVAWQEKLAEVNEENLQDAWLWIKGLEVTWKLIIMQHVSTKLCLCFLFLYGRGISGFDSSKLKI